MPEFIHPGLSPEELEHEIAAELPDREAMSLINPGGSPSLPVLPDTADGGTLATENHMPVYQIQTTEP